MLSYHIYFINFDVTSLLSLFCSISGSNQLPPDLEIRDGSLETMLEWSNPVPYLDSAPDCGWPPRGCRGWATACSAWHTCREIKIGYEHRRHHQLSPLLTQLEGVAPLEALVGFAVLVQVGGRHVSALVLAAHHRDLALLHLEEHPTACRGQQ